MVLFDNAKVPLPKIRRDAVDVLGPDWRKIIFRDCKAKRLSNHVSRTNPSVLQSINIDRHGIHLLPPHNALSFVTIRITDVLTVTLLENK